MEKLKFYIQTFGCQMNDHDSETLAGLLDESGYLEVFAPEDADLILLNTCAIREKAEQKVYSQLGRYKLLKNKRPELLIGVGGCMAQGDGRKVFSRAPYVDLVFGTQTVQNVPDMVATVLEKRRRLVSTKMDNDPAAMEELYRHVRPTGLKSFVTVMQGCDNYCAYCIVPHVRGREMSRPSSEIVSEVARLVEGGVKEVTLLGQNVNSYGLKGGDGVNFPQLISKVAEVEGLKRIRFTTSHPKDLSDELIRLFGEEPKLMPHIHLPLQSGSDAVLRAMNRKYDTARYWALIEKLRGVNPEIAITSDMIVGFPGETEEDFGATLEMMERVVFDGLFSFKFSPRRGTAAADLDGQIDEEVSVERLARLQALQNVHTLAKNRSWIGRACAVLVEGLSKNGQGRVAGRTPENRIVNFDGQESLAGEIVNVRIVEAAVNSMMGEMVSLGGENTRVA